MSAPGLENDLRRLARCVLLIAGIAGTQWCGLPLRAEQPASALAHDDGSRVVTDEAGRRVAIPAVVRRIVTLSPDLTETVYALGLGDRLMGDTNECDTPPAARKKPHVGEPQNPSLEAIVALQPDLVLASTSINRRETVDALARLGIPVYTSNPRTVRGMFGSIEKMAELMGAEDRGRALVSGLQARLDALQQRLENRPLAHALFVVWEDPLITIGQNTFIADALRFAGAESVIMSDQNWPQVSLEEVVRLQPDTIIFTSNHAESGSDHLKELRARPVWKALQAVEMGHVVIASQEMLRPSPGMIGAIEQLARALHPEAFSGRSDNREPRARSGTYLSQENSTPEGYASCVR